MSRRDTIIIALLINAGLLAVLFMLAVNLDDGDVPVQSSSRLGFDKTQLSPADTISSTEKVEISVGDDIDPFLKELKLSETPQTRFIDDEEPIGVAEIDSSDKMIPPDHNSKTLPATAKSDTGNLGYIEIKVKSGDVLEKIARNNGTTVEAIKSANNLSSTKLSIGQVLKIPSQNLPANSSIPAQPIQKPVATTLTPAQKTQEKRSSVSAEPQYYTVKAGDSPWKIAKEMQISVDDLLKLNGLDEGKARNLKVGEKIRVR